MTKNNLKLAGILLGCDAPRVTFMTVIETVNGKDVNRVTSACVACQACQACQA